MIPPPPRAPNIFAYSAYVYLFSHVMFCIHIFTDFHSLYIFINFYIWFLHCSPTGNECFLVVVVVYISIFRRCFSFLVWFSFHVISFVCFIRPNRPSVCKWSEFPFEAYSWMQVWDGECLKKQGLRAETVGWWISKTNVEHQVFL